MIGGLVYIAAAMAALVGMIVAAKAMLAPASALGLGVFKPYRGHPWPRGVQEQDGVHFDWTPAKAPLTPVVPSWADIIVSGGVDRASSGDDPGVARVVDATDELVAVERLHVDVHPAPRSTPPPAEDRPPGWARRADT